MRALLSAADVGDFGVAVQVDFLSCRADHLHPVRFLARGIKRKRRPQLWPFFDGAFASFCETYRKGSSKGGPCVNFLASKAASLLP